MINFILRLIFGKPDQGLLDAVNSAAAKSVDAVNTRFLREQARLKTPVEMFNASGLTCPEAFDTFVALYIVRVGRLIDERDADLEEVEKLRRRRIRDVRMGRVPDLWSWIDLVADENSCN